MWRATALTVMILTGLVLLGGGCFGASNGSGSGNGGDNGQRASDARRRYPLDSLPTTTITIGEHEFRVWLVQESDETRPGALSEGLMHVPTSEIEDDQGMLFVFSDERQRGFWMLNTIAPLDIAYARFDGTIVKIWQMPPLTVQTFPSIEPAMFALEVKQGRFAALGITEGDRIIIPEDAFKTQP